MAKFTNKEMQAMVHTALKCKCDHCKVRLRLIAEIYRGRKQLTRSN